MEWDRHWFFTWTTYGTWLPGDERGFVSRVLDGDGPRVRHNRRGTEHDRDIPGLRLAARRQIKGPPVRWNRPQAECLFAQFQETESTRGWLLIAVAIMAQHVHLEFAVPGDPDSEEMLRDWKSYGSRRLNKRWKREADQRWWTEGGSRIKLPDERAVLDAAAYVRDQEYPLLIWIHPKFLAEIGPRRDRGGLQRPMPPDE